MELKADAVDRSSLLKEVDNQVVVFLDPVMILVTLTDIVGASLVQDKPGVRVHASRVLEGKLYIVRPDQLQPDGRSQ